MYKKNKTRQPASSWWQFDWIMIEIQWIWLFGLNWTVSWERKYLLLFDWTELLTPTIVQYMVACAATKFHQTSACNSFWYMPFFQLMQSFLLNTHTHILMKALESVWKRCLTQGHFNMWTEETVKHHSFYCVTISPDFLFFVHDEGPVFPFLKCSFNS